MAWGHNNYFLDLVSLPASTCPSNTDALAKHNTCSQDQTSLFNLAQDISEGQDENAAQVAQQLETLRGDLITALDKTEHNTALDQSDITRLLQDVKSNLESLISLDLEAKRAQTVLDKLWFDDMLSREALVNDPSGESYS